MFYEKELQKTNQEEFRIEKVIKRKGDKIYVKWKGYDNSKDMAYVLMKVVCLVKGLLTMEGTY